MILERTIIPADASGAQYELAMLRFGAAGARPLVYVQAALHADEIPGMACAAALRRRLEELEAAGAIRGEIVLAPVANPVGLAQRVLGADVGRFDLGGGGNFNRDYPALGASLAARVADRLTDDAAANVALAREALAQLIAELPAATATERLKKALLTAAAPADIVLDLHCDSEAAMHLYTHSRSAEVFAPLAARLAAKAYLVADVSGGDPFDEALSRPWADLAEAAVGRPVPMACHSTTVELRGQQDVAPGLAEADAEAIVGFLADLGAVAGVGGPPPEALCRPTPLAASLPLIAEACGILTYHREVGQSVREGETVAAITDPLTGESLRVPAPCDGMFFARSANRYARPGRRLGKVAGTTAQRTGPLLSP
jgi:hypothetical protein